MRQGDIRQGRLTPVERSNDVRTPPSDNGEVDTQEQVSGPARTSIGRLFDRHVEVSVVALMSITAILTAWTGFQSSKWSGVQATSFSEAGALRTESVRASNNAGQQVAVDVGLFSSWADAYATDQTDLADFYRDRFTPELDVAATAWEALEPLQNADAPPSPFTMDEYVLPAAVEARELEAAAEERAANARDANQQSDDYVVMSVLLASVLFFAALSSKLTSAMNRRIMFALAAVGFVVCASIVATMPIEI